MVATSAGNRLGMQLLERLLDGVADGAGRDELAAGAADLVAQLSGEGCGVWLRDPRSRALRLAAIQHADPGTLLLLMRALRQPPSALQDGTARGDLHAGRAPALAIRDETDGREALGSKERARAAARAGLRAIVPAPLAYRGDEFGWLALLSEDPGAAEDRGMRHLAVEAARQLGRALFLVDQLEVSRLASDSLTLTSLRMQALLESVPRA